MGYTYRVSEVENFTSVLAFQGNFFSFMSSPDYLTFIPLMFHKRITLSEVDRRDR